MSEAKVVIVTGSTRGIGNAVLEAFAKTGYNGVCTGRNQEACDKAAEKLSLETGQTIIGKSVDVSDSNAITELIKSTLEKFGRIDVLVNNAGITKDNLMLRMSEEDWDVVINTNLKSAFLTTKSVLRPMLKNKFGRIINIASVVGLMGNPGQANYAASKGGVIALTKSVAKEIGAKNITCNAIAPGFIDTDMIESLPEDYLNNIIESVPAKRLGRPEEIAATAVFLASDLAGYITGQVIEVGGGIHM